MFSLYVSELVLLEFQWDLQLVEVGFYVDSTFYLLHPLSVQ